MVSFPGQALVKLSGSQFHAVQKLFAAKNDHQGHNRDFVLLDPFCGDIAGAVGNQGNPVSHIFRPGGRLSGTLPYKQPNIL